jgi:hypothetical protein
LNPRRTADRRQHWSLDVDDEFVRPTELAHVWSNADNRVAKIPLPGPPSTEHRHDRPADRKLAAAHRPHRPGRKRTEYTETAAELIEDTDAGPGMGMTKDDHAPEILVVLKPVAVATLNLLREGFSGELLGGGAQVPVGWLV